MTAIGGQEAAKLSGSDRLASRVVAALNAVAQAKEGPFDTRALACLIVENARALLVCHSAGLYVWDSDSTTLVRLAENDPRLVNAPYTYNARQGMASVAMERGEPVVVNDYQSWELALPSALAAGVASCVTIPLSVGNREVGVLTARSYVQRHWQQREVELLSLFGSQISPVLELARLYAEAEQRRAEAEALANMVRTGATERDVDRVMALICEQGARLMSADYSGIAMLGPDGRRALLPGMWGGRTASRPQRPIDRPNAGPGGRALLEGRTVLVEHLDADPNQASSFHDTEGGKTVLSTPLMTPQETLGVQFFGWRRDVSPTPGQIRLAETVAAFAAGILENARAYREEQSARAIAETLADLVRRGAQEPDTERVLQIIVEEAGKLLQADFAVLALMGDDRPVPAATWGELRGDWRRVRLERGRGVLGRAAVERKTVVFDSASAEFNFATEGFRLAHAEAARTMLGTPIFGQSDIVGAFCIGWRTAHDPSRDEQRLAEALASYAATIIENANTHRREQERAAQFAALIEQLPDGVLQIDKGGQVSVMNEAGRSLLGITVGESRAWTDAEMFDIRDANTGKALGLEELPLERALASGKIEHSQLIMRRPSDGGDVYVGESATPLRDADGDMYGALAVLTDITHERELLLELAEKEQRFRALVENSSDVTVLLDASGTVTFATPAMERVLGYPPQEIVGENILSLVHADDLEMARMAFQEVVETPGRSFDMTVRVRHADGSWRHVDAVKLNLLAEPAIGAVVGNMRDVTEKRQAEEIEKSRARALEQERERIAMDLHDGVIQSLYSVVLTLGATRRGSGNAQSSLSEAIEQINGVIGELRSYIYDLRETSSEPLNLCQAVATLAKELIPKSSGVRLQLSLPRRFGCTVQARVVEEVVNIAREALSNVLRHSGARTVKIRLAAGQDRLDMKIEDDGVGFETVATGPRRGDGLRNMQQRATALAGTLDIVSQPGQGTKLRLTAPLAT